ncbi:MAG: hypothetical protein NC312_02785 [Bacteroides fragilis]|nr:hypothetical protein [Bacteroides fragilis]
MKNQKETNKKFTFWISTMKKCMSFHPGPGFEILSFKNHDAMWSRVHEFIDQGYIV